MQFHNKTYFLAYAGILVTLSLIFSYIEALIPFSLGIPGIKIGIANIVVITALYLLGARAAICINIVRVFIAGFLFSGVFGILYSLSGAIFSLAVMILLKKTGKFSILGVSVAGAVFHNFGQVLMAALLVETPKMFLYFPLLIFSGIGFGLLIGLLSTLILN
ncbi:MAG: Gx transporter family protein, partial [Anaerovoracaceae bacterium]